MAAGAALASFVDAAAAKLRETRTEVPRMPDTMALLVYQAWADLDAAVAGLTPAQAAERRDGQSAIAWTVGHVSQQVDSWLNMRIQGVPRHPLLADPGFATGAGGDWSGDWVEMLAAVAEVRARARRYLDAEPAPALDTRVPYDGAVPYLRTVGLSLRHALAAIAAHHWTHAGEIETLRSLRGHERQAAPRGEWGRDFA
jgi:hypothetical protein